ncbi:MAG: PaaI family thioesterase [Immundisolibacter sp.]|uniref:PaaI family thioesterase n=1 Tax=Immundisolibacter sp. TaxID=1934948 RepID=UPI003D0A89BE
MSASERPDLTRIDLTRPPTMEAFGGYIAESAPNYARLVFPFDLRWCNPRGSVQGGVMAVYADEAVGYAMMATFPDLKTVWTTTSLTLNYLRPITGGDITAIGRVIRVGARTGYVEGEILDADGNLCVKAVSGLLILKRPDSR